MISKINPVGDEVNWWVDIDATCHICNNRNLFNSYEIVNVMNIFMRNSCTSRVNGKEEAELKCILGKSMLQQEVLYILEIRKNLISGSIS